MNIEIVGNRAAVDEPGTLARGIIGHLEQVDDISTDPLVNPDLIVFCRRVDDGLGDVITRCNDPENPIPLLFLPSKIGPPTIEGEQHFPLIQARNVNLSVVQYMLDVVDAGTSDYYGCDMGITEHHQWRKKDLSGTALWIIDEVTGSVASGSIRDVRDLEETKRAFPEHLGVQALGPDDFYAIHQTEFIDPVSRQVLKPVDDIVVIGHDGYGAGVEAVARAVATKQEYFTPGNHDIVQMMRDEVIAA